MSNPILYRSFTAGAAMSPYRWAQFSAAETVIQAAAVSSVIIGAVQDVAPASGERVDILMVGIGLIEAGAAFALGARLTSDSVGRATAAAPAAGTNNAIGGIALDAAVAAGDLVRVLLAPATFQG